MSSSVIPSSSSSSLLVFLSSVYYCETEDLVSLPFWAFCEPKKKGILHCLFENISCKSYTHSFFFISLFKHFLYRHFKLVLYIQARVVLPCYDYEVSSVLPNISAMPPKWRTAPVTRRQQQHVIGCRKRLRNYKNVYAAKEARGHGQPWERPLASLRILFKRMLARVQDARQRE